MNRVTAYIYVITTLFSGIFCAEDIQNRRYAITGRVDPPEGQDQVQVDTPIHLNGGEYIGYVVNNGMFIVYDIPAGSYVVEVIHPVYMYEPLKVEISSRGKYTARKLIHIQNSQVIQVPYPLHMKPTSHLRYNVQWRVTDFLFNPMVIMIVLLFLLIKILPKMMNDPETEEDLKHIRNLTKMTEMPEMITLLFSGGSTSNAKQIKKSQ